MEPDRGDRARASPGEISRVLVETQGPGPQGSQEYREDKSTEDQKSRQPRLGQEVQVIVVREFDVVIQHHGLIFLNCSLVSAQSGTRERVFGEKVQAVAPEGQASCNSPVLSEKEFPRLLASSSVGMEAKSNRNNTPRSPRMSPFFQPLMLATAARAAVKNKPPRQAAKPPFESEKMIATGIRQAGQKDRARRQCAPRIGTVDGTATPQHSDCARDREGKDHFEQTCKMTVIPVRPDHRVAIGALEETENGLQSGNGDERA